MNFNANSRGDPSSTAAQSSRIAIANQGDSSDAEIYSFTDEQAPYTHAFHPSSITSAVFPEMPPLVSALAGNSQGPSLRIPSMCTVLPGTSVLHIPLTLNLGKAETKGESRSKTSSFQKLVRGVMCHPSFALLYRYSLETAFGHASGGVLTGYEMEKEDKHIASLRQTAAQHELSPATSQSPTLDMFMAAILTCMHNVQKHPELLRSRPDVCEVIASHRKSNTYLGRGWQRMPVQSPYRGPPQLRRTKLSPEARDTLQNWFDRHWENPYPTDKEKVTLAHQCGIELNQVNNYFGNRRMRIKRKFMAESSARQAHENPHTASGYGGPSALAPRSKWRAVVLSTTARPANSFAILDTQMVASSPVSQLQSGSPAGKRTV